MGDLTLKTGPVLVSRRGSMFHRARLCVLTKLG